MSYDVRRIALSQIDLDDDTYRISTERQDQLTECIRRLGQLAPIHLLDGGSRYKILSGYRRAAACMALGAGDIAARIHTAERLGRRQRCLLAIGDNSSQRPLNSVETARAVALLHRALADGAAVGDCLSALGFPRNPAWVDQQLAVAALPAELHRLMVEGVLGTAMALELGGRSLETAVALGRLFQTLRLGLNRQREVLFYLKDLARRDRCPITRILATPEIAAVLDDPDMDAGVKTAALRHRLRCLRYPALSAAESEFDACRAALGLGPHIRLDPPPFFEGNEYGIRMAFDSIEALQHRIDTLRDASASPHLRKILARTND